MHVATPPLAVQQRRGYTVANADRRLSIILYAERQIAPSRGNLGNFTLNGKNYLKFLGLHHPNDF